MPRVELNLGEALVVTFADTDGEITIAYSDPEVPVLVGCREEVAGQLQALGGIAVHCDMPDTSGREGVVYHEPMGLLVDSAESAKALISHKGE